MGKARRKDKDTSQTLHDEPKLYLEEAVLEHRLSTDVDLKTIVELPERMDYNEWLASHTLAFFEHINLLYGTISEFCTMSGCPDMTGPGYRQYLWFDEKGKKCKVAAPQYIDYVMTFTQKTINDETIFPTKYANDFPTSFEPIVKKIHRLLFHVLAHMYQAHFKELVLLALHSHLNCIFAHFFLFNEQFKLTDDKEIEILHDLAAALKLDGPPDGDKDDPSVAAGAESADADNGKEKSEKDEQEREKKGDDLSQKHSKDALDSSSVVVSIASLSSNSSSLPQPASPSVVVGSDVRVGLNAVSGSPVIGDGLKSH